MQGKVVVTVFKGIEKPDYLRQPDEIALPTQVDRTLEDLKNHPAQATFPRPLKARALDLIREELAKSEVQQSETAKQALLSLAAEMEKL